MSWERARQPAQKAARRDAILASAAQCFDAGGLAGATLSAIADGAGLSKANLYRYFESREVVLLEVLAQESAAWAEEVVPALGSLSGSNDAARVAQVITESLTARPRMCALSAVAVAVLERQVSKDSIVAFKQRMIQVLEQAVVAIGAAMPALSPPQLLRVVRYTNLMLGPLWMAANPAPALAEVLAEPAFADRRIAFGPALEDFVRVLLQGMLAED